MTVNQALTVAERLSQGGALAAWFLVIVLGTALAWLYKTTVPRDVYLRSVDKIADSQDSLIKSSAENTQTLSLVLGLLKDVIREIVGK